MTMELFPDNWRSFLGSALDEDNLNHILTKLEEKRRMGTVYPDTGNVFKALEITSPEQVRVIIIGQDPYHEPKQAVGLAFAVPQGVKMPPSLRNIFQEFADDLETSVPQANLLERWAHCGVLLLNAVLSVDAGVAGSHRALGWERFTDSLISALSKKRDRLVFILWGAFAQGKIPLIDQKRHLIISSAHPSPLSAHRGFFGSRPFSRAEVYLQDWHWPRSVD